MQNLLVRNSFLCLVPRLNSQAVTIESNYRCLIKPFKYKLAHFFSYHWNFHHWYPNWVRFLLKHRVFSKVTNHCRFPLMTYSDNHHKRSISYIFCSPRNMDSTFSNNDFFCMNKTQIHTFTCPLLIWEASSLAFFIALCAGATLIISSFFIYCWQQCCWLFKKIIGSFFKCKHDNKSRQRIANWQPACKGTRLHCSLLWSTSINEVPKICRLL